jgi:short subunit dehydrogenase-like uncharacterized protein
VFTAHNKKELGSRQYDLVIYGATGFTGNLCVEYLYTHKKDTALKWAIAGRSREKLEEIKEKLKLNNLGIFVADCEDVEELTKMVNDCRIVLTTAGPF